MTAIALPRLKRPRTLAVRLAGGAMAVVVFASPAFGSGSSPLRTAAATHHHVTPPTVGGVHRVAGGTVNVRHAAITRHTRARSASKTGHLLRAPGQSVFPGGAHSKHTGKASPSVGEALPRAVATTPATLTTAHGFQGMTNQSSAATYGCAPSDMCLEPPDPFVAVGPTHLVQTVNTEPCPAVVL
jgi:hypothetical protein